MTIPTIADEYVDTARRAMVEAFGGSFVVAQTPTEKALARPRGPGAELGPRFRCIIGQQVELVVELAMPFSPPEQTWLQQLAGNDVERVRYTRTLSFERGPEFALLGRWLDVGPLRRALGQVDPGRSVLWSAEWEQWRLACRFRLLPGLSPFEVVRCAVATRAGLLAAMPEDLRDRVLNSGERPSVVEVDDAAATWLGEQVIAHNGIVERTMRGVVARVHLGGLVDEGWTGEVIFGGGRVSLRMLLPPSAGRLRLEPQTGLRGMWLSLFEDRLEMPPLDQAFVVQAEGTEKAARAKVVAHLLLRLGAADATLDWDADTLTVSAPAKADAQGGDVIQAGLELWRRWSAMLAGYDDEGGDPAEGSRAG